MALQKLTYTDGVTVIPASNLNAIQDAIIALENKPDNGVSDDLKVALLQLASKVAYIDDQGQQYYDDLYDALYPPKTLVSITAVFTQGSTVVYDNASLDSLKTMLAVTAHYDDNTTAIVPDNAYTLSGTLTPGTSTVTVTYNSKTTTFNVNVTAAPTLSSISAVYTQSGTVYATDSLDSLKTDLVVTATYSDSSTETVAAEDYTLSGTLAAGTSTITVSYGGKTTTFTVSVTAWDFAWEYTDGLLENEEYWIVSAASTGSSTMLSDGEKIVGGNNSYRQLYPKDAPYMYMVNGYGVMELVVYGSWASAVATTAPFLVNTGNSAGSMRLCLMVNQGKWKLRNASDYSQATQLSDAVSNTVYKVRIVLRGSVGDVYINDVLVGENIDTSTMTTGGANSLTNNTDTSFTVLQAVRIKSGSV